MIKQCKVILYGRDIPESIVREEFFKLMEKWDKSSVFLNAYYDRDVLDIKRSEAYEICRQRGDIA